jgi:hypothetical protein
MNFTKKRVQSRNPGLETAEGDVVTLDGECGEPGVPTMDPILVELLLESEEMLNRLRARETDPLLRQEAATISGRICRTLESN